MCCVTYAVHKTLGYAARICCAANKGFFEVWRRCSVSGAFHRKGVELIELCRM
jgi:hypothetical protein